MEGRGLGVIGCGRFARFLLAALAELPGVTLRALSSRRDESMDAAFDAWARGRAAAGRAAGEPPRRHRCWRDLLDDPRVTVVAIATPPHLHTPIARAALAAGKHVFLEKPGALDPADLARTAEEAGARGLSAAPNFVMRWNPLWRLVLGAARAGHLGRLERAAVENHAHGDLPPEHWFWDPERSGGILVEHGVHFFDLMALLAGPAREVQATAPPNALGAHLAPDRVFATVRHGDGGAGALVGHYHAFTRPGGMGRAWVDLAFDRGTIRLEGWTAHALEADLYLTPEGEGYFRGAPLPPEASRLLEAEALPPGRRRFESRRQPFEADRRVRVLVRLGDPEAVYAGCVRDGFRALLARIATQREGGTGPAAADPDAPGLGDAARALRLAVATRTAAETGGTVPLPPEQG